MPIQWLLRGLHKLSISDRLRVWGWRARRRIGRDGRYIRTISWGGALGAGLSFGFAARIAGRGYFRNNPASFFITIFRLGFSLAVGPRWGWR